MASGRPQNTSLRTVHQRRPARLWLGMLFSVAFSAVVFLAFLAVVASAIAGPDHRSSTIVGAIVVGAFFLGLLVLCVRWAIRAEHRLRDNEPASHSGLDRAWHRSARTRHHGPISTALSLLLFGGATIALIAAAISDHAQGSRSAYTQTHGVSRTALVTDVVNTEHCGKYSCTYTSAITLQLSSPVGQSTESVAHYNGSSDVLEGERLPVLVDPRQPDYAELPGSPFKGAHTWITSAIFAVVCGLFTALLVRGAVRHRAQRRTRVAAAATAA